MKTVVDNIAVQCIEHQLIKPLPNIFSPATVIDMDDATVRKVAEESTANAELRTSLLRKTQVLEAGLDTCRRHATLQRPGKLLKVPVAVLQAINCLTGTMKEEGLRNPVAMSSEFESDASEHSEPADNISDDQLYARESMVERAIDTDLAMEPEPAVEISYTSDDFRVPSIPEQEPHESPVFETSDWRTAEPIPVEDEVPSIFGARKALTPGGKKKKKGMKVGKVYEEIV